MFLWVINLEKDNNLLLWEIHQHVDFIIKIVEKSRIEILTWLIHLEIKNYNYKRFQNIMDVL